MMFRPLPLLSVMTILSLMLLIMLGVWQARRAEWKSALIDAYETAEREPAISLEVALCMRSDMAPRISTVLADDNAPTLRVYGFGRNDAPGWRLFRALPAPACSQGARYLLAEVGFEPLSSPEGAQQAMDPAPKFWRLVPIPARTWVSAPNSPNENEWHWFDMDQIEQFFGAQTQQEIDRNIYLAADIGAPSALTLTPPSRHVGYSVTWFGMAIGLIVIYFGYHARVGRLRWRKRTHLK